MNIIRRILRSALRAFLIRSRILKYKILSTNHIEGNPKLLQPLLAIGPGKIFFSDNVTVGNYLSAGFFNTYAYFEARSNTASIYIGSGTHFNNNTSIVCHSAKISIGNNCLIGENLIIYDSNFHPLEPENRFDNSKIDASDIKIGNNVFIGSNVTILKGASIEDNSVIGSGSVIFDHVPKNSLVSPSKYKIIKTFK